MNHSSPIRKPPAPSLDPVLCVALGCLDIGLEDELLRYRRDRRQNPRSKLWQDRAAHLHADAAGPVGQSDPAAVAEFAIDPLSDRNRADVPGRDAAMAAEDATVPEFVSRRRAAQSASSLVRHPQADDFNKLNQSVESIPDDYMESTEQLLRNLADSPTAENFEEFELEGEAIAIEKRSSFTPLGVVGIALILATGTLIGAISIDTDVWQRWRNSSDSSAPEPPPLTAASGSSSGSTPITQPDLASGEFVDLQLDRLSNLKEDGESAPPPTPAEAAVPPQATATVPVAAAPAPAANSNWFFVVVPYSGNSAFQSTRAVVPDAYLVNFPVGVRIQVGAFRRQDEAVAHVAQLARQGIAAEVYRP
ncbi:hypothetical protein KR51_00027690 [Rubidibacter lacunae KORDI 51-2]|uniref:SPOR domain-containing protein n=1 Tax=Rubidibacter lacunae KORDI 51-2 TaxID=582515 RepID=U5DM36_9CHRO|nr:hypothetical protein [Rubidibacter lacunae]ERN40780.1 hypothetical protein KR51_00027690 [Rubidibacter lacunae KORDI 51-2]